MNKQCKQFRERVTHHWDIRGTIDELVHRDSHYADCRRCQEYAEEFFAFTATLERLGDHALPEPDFARMRVNVWERIDKKNQQVGLPLRILRPAILAPVFAILLAMIIWWAIPDQQRMTQDIEVDTEVLLAAGEELDLSYYPEESLNTLISNEMGESVYDYFLGTEGYYTMIEEANLSDEEWNQIVETLSERSI